MDNYYIAEYIWLDKEGIPRSKSKTIFNLNSVNIKITDLLNKNNYDDWSYDGSSTGQLSGEGNTEIIIKPVSIFIDPFRELKHPNINVLVLCDTYKSNGQPTESNHRFKAMEIFNKYGHTNPWYGIEQEFFIMSNDNTNISSKTFLPYKQNFELNNPTKLSSNIQGQYYCSSGGNNAFGRNIVNEAYNLSLKAGVKCSGMNAEVAPSQWEIQVGPCEGIEAGDHLVILRYILNRVSEKFNVQINLDPKPLPKDFNGSGCHVNFSTKNMRNRNGILEIMSSIKKLELKHKEHMKVYGKDNEKRMSGEKETSDFNTFTWGIATRNTSIRIPLNTNKEEKGYFEDRRPSSNMDPYIVTSKILETICY